MEITQVKNICDLKLSATLDNVGNFRDQLRMVWEANDLPHGVLNGLLLVITELCNNSYEYSDPPPTQFNMVCQLHEDVIGIIIRDDGESFDPHNGANPNFWNDFNENESPVHLGAGCYLVLHYFPDLTYTPASESPSGLNEFVFDIPLEN